MGSKAADLAAMELEAPRRALVDFRCARIENSHLVPRIVGPERSESLAPGALAVIHLLRRPTDLQSHRTAITYRLDHRPRPVLVCLHRHPCWKSDTFRSRFAGRCLVGGGYATWVTVGRQPCDKPMLKMQLSHAFADYCETGSAYFSSNRMACALTSPAFSRACGPSAGTGIILKLGDGGLCIGGLETSGV